MLGGNYTDMIYQYIYIHLYIGRYSAKKGLIKVNNHSIHLNNARSAILYIYVYVYVYRYINYCNKQNITGMCVCMCGMMYKVCEEN